MSARQTAVEIRSLDHVPLPERHGKLWHLGPLWFNAASHALPAAQA